MCLNSNSKKLKICNQKVFHEKKNIKKFRKKPMLCRKFILSKKNIFSSPTTKISSSLLLESVASFHTTTNSNKHYGQQQRDNTIHNNNLSQSSNNNNTTSHFRSTSTPFVVKDREPFPGSELRDGKLKLAILIDGEKVLAQTYAHKIEKELLKEVGTICLRRYFRYEKSQNWTSVFLEEETLGNNSGSGEHQNQNNNNKSQIVDESSSSPRKTPITMSVTGLLGPPQYFRVDSFIPINMQLEADAAHIVEFRNENLTTGVVFVVEPKEVPNYEVLVRNSFKPIADSSKSPLKLFVAAFDEPEGKVLLKKF